MSKGSSGVLPNYDDFLKHTSGGGGGAYLKNWRDEGSVDVWPHPKAPPGVRWAHAFWELKKFKKKAKRGEETEVEELASIRWICHEREAILRRQRFRTDNIGRAADKTSKDPRRVCGGIVGNGEREYPPETCPHCLFNEWLRDGIRTERLLWTDVLFEWKLTDGSDKEIITIGGFCGLFGRPTNDYTAEQLAQLRRANVERDEAYLENGTARCDYLMRVVDESDPGAGCVIAPVADALGRMVQKAFKDRIEQTKGAFKPSETPLLLRWKYDDDKDFDKKYDVVPLPDARPSDEVLDALEADPPSIDNLLEPGNVITLRAQMEKHCVLEGVPWDQFFGKAEALEQAGPGDEPWDKEKTSSASKPATEPARQPTPEPQKPQPAPVPATAKAGVELDAYDCEVCNGDNSVPKGSPPPSTCRHCGTEYDPDTGAITFNATLPVSASNKPRVTEPAQTQAPVTTAPAEQPPPAGREPGRRRRARSASA